MAMKAVLNKLTGVIETPLATDILCGKDKTFSQHPGNVFYREMIERHAAPYSLAATKQDKIKITRKILTDLEGRRFLQPAPAAEGWVLVPRQKVRDKTSHALRFYCNQHADSLRRNEQREKFMQQQHDDEDDHKEEHEDHDPMDTLRSQDLREIMGMSSTEQFDTLRSEDMGEIFNLSVRRHDDEGDVVMGT